MINRLNHAVLWVSDLREAEEFYTKVLNFTVVKKLGINAVFLRA